MNKKGFTLIELVIVMAVIGILAATVLVSLGGFRARARDASRISDLRQTQNALELYYGLNNAYPDATSWDTLVTALINTDLGIKKMGKDPLSGHPVYEYATDGQSYVLKATFEQYNKALDDDMDDTVLGILCGTAGDAEREYCISF